MTRAGDRRSLAKQEGFTLLELIVALVLLGLLSAVLFGSLRLAGRSTQGGEAAVKWTESAAKKWTL